MAKKKKVYIYHDADHGDIEVFDDIEKAKAYTKTQWGDEQDWEDCVNEIHDLVSDYVTIYTREVRTDTPEVEEYSQIMPYEDEVHECVLLKYEGRYLEYCCSGKTNARWRLISPDELVILQIVLFCPACGLDLRGDTSSNWGGKPDLNRILRERGVKAPEE